jgi:hypothetical protein
MEGIRLLFSLSFLKKYGSTLPKAPTLHQTVTLWECNGISCSSLGFTGEQYRMFCSFTKPEIWKWAARRGACISGSNTGCIMLRGSIGVLATHSIRQFILHFTLRCVTVCHHISIGLYYRYAYGRKSGRGWEGVIPSVARAAWKIEQDYI